MEDTLSDLIDFLLFIISNELFIWIYSFFHTVNPKPREMCRSKTLLVRDAKVPKLLLRQTHPKEKVS